MSVGRGIPHIGGGEEPHGGGEKPHRGGRERPPTEANYLYLFIYLFFLQTLKRQIKLMFAPLSKIIIIIIMFCTVFTLLYQIFMFLWILCERLCISPNQGYCFGKQVAQRFRLLEISSDNVLDFFMYRGLQVILDYLDQQSFSFSFW